MRSADRGERLKEKVFEAKTKKEVDCFNQLQLQLHMSSGDYDKVVITNIQKFICDLTFGPLQ